MAIVRKHGEINVVEAARQRVQNVFNSGLKITMSTSGGKDSICMMHVVYSLIEEGKINPSQLTVQFIDEEAMYDDVIDIVKLWRKKFLLTGAKFDWYCIPVYHFNCLNTVEAAETHILWDNSKKDSWIREMPSFAITTDPLLHPYKDNYQSFLERKDKDSINLVGCRTAESIQRLQNVATVLSKNSNNYLSSGNKFYPIYDWKDVDVWLYIKNENLEFPKTYLDLYQIGTAVNRLRISQFFSMDAIRGLLKLSEIRPDLMERILKREPNAYLVLLYWDSEMFGKHSKGRKEQEDKDIDWRKKTLEIFSNVNKHLKTTNLRSNALLLKKIVLKYWFVLETKTSLWELVYDSLITGDSKSRKARSMINQFQIAYANKLKEGEIKNGKH